MANKESPWCKNYEGKRYRDQYEFDNKYKMI